MKKLYLTIIFMIYAAICYSAPIVSDVENGVITLTGGGTKSTAAPTAWDNFEDGSVNTTATVGNWQDVGYLLVSSDNNRSSLSNYNAVCDLTITGVAGVQSPNATLSQKWFAQYWVYLGSDFDWGESTYGGGDEQLSNVKILRMWNPGEVNENFYAQFGWEVTSNSYSAQEYIETAEAKTFDTTFSKNSLGSEEWHCLQFEFLDSDVSVSNAEFRMWFDGQLKEERTGFITREDFAELKRISHMGFYNAWSDNGDGSDHVYFDDFYCDTTWARVEVGDSSTFSSCTHREIQIPTAWSDTEISITANQGSFSPNTQLYLFVIDSDGTASTGFPVYFDSEGTLQSGTPVCESCNIQTFGNVTLSGNVSFNS